MGTAFLANVHHSKHPHVKAWLQEAWAGSRQGVPDRWGRAHLVGTAMPHLGAVVVQLEGQHHSPVDVDFLGPINVLRADLQAGTGALPGKLGSLRVGDVTDLILLSGSLGWGEDTTHFPTLSAYSQRGQRWGHQIPGCPCGCLLALSGHCRSPLWAKWSLPSFHHLLPLVQQ